MRAEKSIKNAIISLISQFLICISGFAMRYVFIKVLNSEYLGLSNLFANVLTVLSLAELGVGSAITFSLYKPISENDTKQIIALMQLFKRFYIFVGMFVLSAGLLLAPFLPFIVKEMPKNVEHIYIIFIMYVVNSGISYFYSYKATFLNAVQEYYIYSLNHSICYVFMILIQIGVLIITKNFLIYYAIQIIMTLVENILISYIAGKKYPILKSKDRVNVYDDTMKNIKINVLAMIGHNIGNIVLNSTDNIIISKFVGVVEVGLYSNYLMITSAINSFLLQIFVSVNSSIGNLLIEGSDEQKDNTFYVIFFVDFWIYTVASIAIFVLSTPSIELFFGNEYKLEESIVAVIAIYFYSTGMRQTCISFKNADGLFLQDVHKAYIEATLNLIVSIFLVKKIGIIGVLLGTLISTYSIAIWIEPYVLFKYGFKKSVFPYFKRFITYLISFLTIGVITRETVNMVKTCGIIGLILKGFIVLIVSSLFIIILNCRTKEFKLLFDTLLRIIRNKQEGNKSERK